MALSYGLLHNHVLHITLLLSMTSGI